MDKLALKLRLFQWAAEYEKPFGIDDAMTALEPEYGRERQFTRKRIDTYLQSLLGACMIEAVQITLNEKQELEVKYALTDFGKGRIKHIPR